MVARKLPPARTGHLVLRRSAAATVRHGRVQEVAVEDVGGRKEQLIRVERRFPPDHRGASRGRLRSVGVRVGAAADLVPGPADLPDPWSACGSLLVQLSLKLFDLLMGLGVDARNMIPRAL